MTWLVILAVGAGSFVFRLGPLLVLQRVALSDRGDRADPPRRHRRDHRPDRRVDEAQRDRERGRPDAAGGRRRRPSSPPAGVDAAPPGRRRRDLRLAASSSSAAIGSMTGRVDREDARTMPTIHITLLGGFAVAVDGVPVAESHWTRRHAAALVKVLALAPGRRLHREQIIDLVWPDDTIDEAAPKLHKAAHFARRAIDVPNSVVLRGDNVAAVPRRRHDGRRRAVRGARPPRARRRGRVPRPARRCALRRRAAAAGPLRRRGPRSAGSSSGCATSTCCASTGGGRRWSSSTPSDELAHLALMRRHAANGDRHAALRQFERMDRTLRRELGVAPGREALALRDRLLAEHDVVPPSRRCAGRPRTASWRSSSSALLDAAAGRSRTLIVERPGRRRQVVAARRDHGAGHGAGLPRRPRHVGAGRGGVAVRAGGRGARRPVPAPPDAARRPRRPPPRGDRPGPRRRRGLVDRRELAPAAVRRRGRAGPPGVGHERPAAHHRRRPRRRRRQPASRCTTSPARRTTSGCASCSPTGRRR